MWDKLCTSHTHTYIYIYIDYHERLWSMMIRIEQNMLQHYEKYIKTTRFYYTFDPLYNWLRLWIFVHLRPILSALVSATHARTRRASANRIERRETCKGKCRRPSSKGRTTSYNAWTDTAAGSERSDGNNKIICHQPFAYVARCFMR